MNFWDETHPLTEANTRLFNELVPSSGKCDTLQGECLRAASKISYDWYNNGWGCNNWSGAVVFLLRNGQVLASQRTERERAAFVQALSDVRYYSHGERATISDERADELVTTIQAFVVQTILDNPTPIANTVDMWSLSEPDARQWDDEDDDVDYSDQDED